MPDPNILEKVNLDNTEYLLKDSATGTLTATEINTGTDTSGKFISASVLKSVLSSGGTVTDVKVNGVSVLDSEGVANISEDVVNITYTVISGTDHEMIISSVYAPNYAETLLSEAY